MLKAKIVGQPTPQHVLDAISTIQEYLKDGGWCQTIINSAGGVSFQLTDIYDLKEEFINFLDVGLAAVAGVVQCRGDALQALEDKIKP